MSDLLHLNSPTIKFPFCNNIYHPNTPAHTGLHIAPSLPLSICPPYMTLLQFVYIFSFPSTYWPTYSPRLLPFQPCSNPPTTSRHVDVHLSRRLHHLPKSRYAMGARVRVPVVTSNFRSIFYYRRSGSSDGIKAKRCVAVRRDELLSGCRCLFLGFFFNKVNRHKVGEDPRLWRPHGHGVDGGWGMVVFYDAM